MISWVTFLVNIGNSANGKRNVSSPPVKMLVLVAFFFSTSYKFVWAWSGSWCSHHIHWLGLLRWGDWQLVEQASRLVNSISVLFPDCAHLVPLSSCTQLSSPHAAPGFLYPGVHERPVHPIDDDHHLPAQLFLLAAGVFLLTTLICNVLSVDNTFTSIITFVQVLMDMG